MENVADHHRVEYIQLEVALRAVKADRCVVAHDLDTYHGTTLLEQIVSQALFSAKCR